MQQQRHTVSPWYSTGVPGQENESRFATSSSPFNAYEQHSDPNRPSRPAAVFGTGARRDGEGSTDSIIPERSSLLSLDQARARSPPSRTTSRTGPFSLESLVKALSLIEHELGSFPDPQNRASQQPNISSVNGFTARHGTIPDSTDNLTTDLTRDLDALQTELERLRRREAQMAAALAQASRAGFVYNSDDSPPSSDIERIFVAALESYKEKTGKDLKNHDLFKQLEACDSPATILAVFQAAQFDPSRTGAPTRMKQWLFRTLDVLCTFSNTLGQGVGLVITVLSTTLSVNKF